MTGCRSPRHLSSEGRSGARKEEEEKVKDKVRKQTGHT